MGAHRDLHDTDEQRRVLTLAYESALDEAVRLGVRRVALCCVSTGAYRVDSRRAAHIALGTVRRWLEANHRTSSLHVVFCTHLRLDDEIYLELMKKTYFKIN